MDLIGSKLIIGNDRKTECCRWFSTDHLLLLSPVRATFSVRIMQPTNEEESGEVHRYRRTSLHLRTSLLLLLSPFCTHCYRHHLQTPKNDDSLPAVSVLSSMTIPTFCQQGEPIRAVLNVLNCSRLKNIKGYVKLLEQSYKI